MLLRRSEINPDKVWGLETWYPCSWGHDWYWLKISASNGIEKHIFHHVKEEAYHWCACQAQKNGASDSVIRSSLGKEKCWIKWSDKEAGEQVKRRSLIHFEEVVQESSLSSSAMMKAVWWKILRPARVRTSNARKSDKFDSFAARLVGNEVTERSKSSLYFIAGKIFWYSLQVSSIDTSLKWTHIPSKSVGTDSFPEEVGPEGIRRWSVKRESRLKWRSCEALTFEALTRISSAHSKFSRDIDADILKMNPALVADKLTPTTVGEFIAFLRLVLRARGQNCRDLFISPGGEESFFEQLPRNRAR